MEEKAYTDGNDQHKDQLLSEADRLDVDLIHLEDDDWEADRKKQYGHMPPQIDRFAGFPHPLHVETISIGTLWNPLPRPL